MNAVAVLSGLGKAVPDRIVTNDDLAAVMDTNDEWIRTRTGIRERRWAQPGQSSDDLGETAARMALTHFAGSVSAGIDRIDTVIKATFTPPSRCVTGAATIASKLGIRTPFAFDIQAACSGFVYGSAVAQGLIAAGIAKNVLVIGAEVTSTSIAPDDRGTAILFGDGAGAAIYTPGEVDEPGALGPFDLHTDGTASDILDWRGSDQMMNPAWHFNEQVNIDHHWFLQMNGTQVYKRAVPAMATSTQAALDMRGWSIDQLDHLIGHQANQRILHAVAQRLHLDPAKAFTNLQAYGNTSAASIPLALTEASEQGVLKAGDTVALTAFGAGLTWGSTTLIWPDLPPIPDIFS
ncbi:beta-ketoacyl-ACP synthase III [Stomatohabitans albus]|uniref:beta-ketoacyl-ACP synthase III n=1 Tax=Stomatohabitans albus TaxID=3110766 RepID=UPI00300C3CED